MPISTSERPGGGAPHLFCFGCGYAAAALGRRLQREGWRISGTCRTDEQRSALQALDIEVHVFNRERPLEDAAGLLAAATDILSSVPPDEAGDPVLDVHGDTIAALPDVRWIGYLSTTGVYGDTGGAMVDETAPLEPTSERGLRRVAAERAWLDLRDRQGLPVHIFRLAGIYGPGRSAFDQIRDGRAKRIHRPGHVFSRIHVDDIVSSLRASIARPAPGRVYNVCDDEPAEPGDVMAFACNLLEVEPPPTVPFDAAAAEMSPMALSFWRDNRRVSNARLKRELGVELAYPDFRAGLTAILAAEQRRRA